MYIIGFCMMEDEPTKQGSASMPPALVISCIWGYKSGDGDDDEADAADSA